MSPGSGSTGIGSGGAGGAVAITADMTTLLIYWAGDSAAARRCGYATPDGQARWPQ